MSYTKPIYLFIIFLEPHWRWLQKGINGYSFQTSNMEYGSVAYAYDLVVLDNNISTTPTN